MTQDSVVDRRPVTGLNARAHNEDSLRRENNTHELDPQRGRHGTCPWSWTNFASRQEARLLRSNTSCDSIAAIEKRVELRRDGVDVHPEHS